MSPDACVVGSLGRRECDVGVCAFSSTGICSIYDSDVYCGVITVGVVREIVPGVRTRKLVLPKLVSAKVYVAGSCAGPSGGPSFGIRSVLCAFVAARVQFDPGGPKL